MALNPLVEGRNLIWGQANADVRRVDARASPFSANRYCVVHLYLLADKAGRNKAATLLSGLNLGRQRRQSRSRPTGPRGLGRAPQSGLTAVTPGVTQSGFCDLVPRKAIKAQRLVA